MFAIGILLKINIFQPISRLPWKKISMNTAEGACMVHWKNYLIVFGGQASKRAVQKYSIDTGEFNKNS